MIAITPLEAWIKDKIGVSRSVTGKAFIDALASYQLRKLNEVIEYARRTTSFYGRHLASSPAGPIPDLSAMARLPFTCSSHLINNPSDFLAVRQDEIARIVTLRTSGSTGPAKRLFFTEADLDLTVDFFHHGMSTLTRPGQRVMIFLPGDKPDSVGDLLARGLTRMDVESFVYGPIADPLDAARAISSFEPHCLVGIPTQVLAVARSHTRMPKTKNSIETILLSTDYVPTAIVKALADHWGCRVFNHYGMTETGLGGGVECEALDGYHLREADLYFEIVDRETGYPCPDGAIGEVVFTTLTRRGTPLIRYRTGDMAQMLTAACPCGTALRRMARVTGRWNGAVTLGHGCTLTLAAMDEALFHLPDLLDYRVSMLKKVDGRFGLHIDVHTTEDSSLTEKEVLHAAACVDAIRDGIAEEYLETPTVRFSAAGCWITTGVSKRQIVVSKE
jgi:phenylacetate-CoA ligase